MIKMYNRIEKIFMKIPAIFILIFIILSPIAVMYSNIESLFGNNQELSESDQTLQDYMNGIPNLDGIDPSLLNNQAFYNESFNVGSFLTDKENTYSEEWDPWLSQAAIHCIATSENIPYLEDGDMMALAGGYLYDDEVHVYRWNYKTDQYDLVWEVGDGIFKSDILTLTFTDSDYNNLTELICGCEDGYLYVFEQRHLYDPITNMENMFDLVWKSPRLGRIYSVIVSDTDKDYRKEIIAGTGNTLRMYEYLHHGGYPFSTDHWIEFEEIFSLEMPSQITALAAADANYNGLPEIAVGMKSGEIKLVENDGTVLIINGEPYPITQDNAFHEIWSSNNIIHRPITSMTGGNLDLDNTIEIIVAAQGQGAFILDTFDNTIGVYRLEREYDSWENDPKGAYPLDHWLDSMVNSSVVLNSSAQNITNVYLLHSGDKYFEPLNESSINAFPTDIYPYNSAMVQQSLTFFTYFEGEEYPAWAVLDFGNDEEAAGNGIPSIADLSIVKEIVSGDPSVVVSISIDGIDYYPITELSSGSYDVDTALAAAGWDYYRFLKINVTSGTIRIDYVETSSINKPIYDALSTTISTIHFSGESSPFPAAYLGTVDGAILATTWNSTLNKYEISWDSWKDERWKLNKNVFSLATIKKHGNFPAWIWKGANPVYLGGSLLQTYQLPDGGNYTSLTANNFYDWWFGDSVDYIVSSDYGNLFFYEQESPSSLLTYDEDLSIELLQEVNDYLDIELGGPQYVSASVFPMTPDDLTIDSLYWLFVGVWDGSMGSTGLNNLTVPPIGSVDIHAFYLKYYYAGTTLHQVFEPVVIDHLDTNLTLSNSDLTGQLGAILRESTWMPKVIGEDFIGSSHPDLIVTNGKVHLLETLNVKNPPMTVGTIEPYGELDTVLVSDYFKEINENSKGLHYTNANPVNFDGDEDFDLILGFARYDTDNFGFEKLSYGMTYWENEGSREEPKWIEKKKAVTNNVPESNFRVNHFCDPVLIYDEYDFSGAQNPVLGYHPKYLVKQPTRLIMFQAYETYSFIGTIHQFTADYAQPTSLLAATYPEAKRVDINLINRPYKTNFGFHIFETWDNEKELREWTMAITSSDLDEDGKNEIIVGDFNNNMYVFEHLTEDTYKIAFSSFDINSTIVTNDSPYAFEQFSGISGNFTRTVFNHIKFLHAGCDLDRDGLQEIIATSDNMVFIFEATLSPSGMYIADDTYKLIKIIDIYAEAKLKQLNNTDFQITALTTAKDFTHDGRNELLLGVSSALLIYEVDELFNFEEIFFPSTISSGSTGIYDIPGNYLRNENYLIQVLLVEDFDNDGFDSLAIGGIDRNDAIPITSGFIHIVEWIGDEFIHLAGEETFIKTTEFNSINDFAVDDSDYDGHKELIIGHDKGIDIYEFTGNNQIELRELITSNPNYPLMDTSYWNPTGATVSVDKDVLRLQNGTLLMVYSTYTDLMLARSDDDGETWEYVKTVFESFGNIIGVEEPALGEDEEQNIWLAFVIVLQQSVSTPPNILRQLYAMKNFDLGSSVGVATSSYIYINTSFPYSPSIYKLPYGSGSEIGLVYNYPDLTGHKVKFGVLNGSSGISYTEDAVYSWVNGTKSADHYTVLSLDVVYIEAEDCGIVFSGYLNCEEASMDLDLFYGIFTVDINSNYKFYRPNRITNTGMSSIRPSIITEKSTNHLLISYEEATLKPYGGLWAIWSNDGGWSWQGPYDMTHPLGYQDEYDLVRPVTVGDSFYLEYYMPADGYFTANTFDQYEVKRPVLVPGSTEGFSMVYSLYFELSEVVPVYYYIATASNFLSNFTLFKIDSVTDLAIGDSDSDGRFEILAASGKHAILLEYSSNTKTWIDYQQKWISPEYDRCLTSVEISDGNGNTLPELFIETDRGVVNSYEVINKQPRQVDILVPYREAVLSHTSNMLLQENSVNIIIPAFINEDNIQDFLYSTGLGEIIAIDGGTLQPMYITGFDSSIIDTDSIIRLVFDSTTNTTPMIAIKHDNNFSLFDFFTGELITSLDFTGIGGRITACYTGELISGTTGFEEIIIGLVNDSILAYSYNPSTTKLELAWKNSLYSLGFIGDYESPYNIEIGFFNDNSKRSVLVTSHESSITPYGHVMLLSGESGEFLWNHSSTYPNVMLCEDINNDGFRDIITGFAPTVAYDGITGVQLWNNSGWGANARNPIVYDVNLDGVPDILFGQSGEEGSTYNGYVGAIDGVTGEYLWNYTTISANNIASSFGSITIDETYNVFLGSCDTGLGYILDFNGFAIASMETTFGLTSLSSGTAIVSAYLNFTHPVILLGDSNGNISIYSLFKGAFLQDKVSPLQINDIISGDVIQTEDKFSLLAHDINDDGYDEIIYIGNGLISAYSSSNGEEIWSSSIVKEYGTYQGVSEISFATSSNYPVIIAIYGKNIVAINFTAPIIDILWDYTLDGDGSWTEASMIIEDLNGDLIEEIILSRNINSAGSSAQIVVINGVTATKNWSRDLNGFHNVKMNIGDFSNDGNLDIFSIFHSTSNLHTQKWLMLDLNGNIIDEIDNNLITIWPNYPPVDCIAVGEFNTVLPGDEFIVVQNFADLGNYRGFDYSNHKTRFVLGGLNSSLALVHVLSITYESKYTAHLQNNWALDLDNDGLDEFLGLTENGDLFGFDLNAFAFIDGKIYFKEVGDLPHITVPYSSTIVIKGNFTTVDSYVFASYDTVYCIENISSFNSPTVNWFATFGHSTVKEMVSGNFDDDNQTDLVVVDENGKMWIISSSTIQMNTMFSGDPSSGSETMNNDEYKSSALLNEKTQVERIKELFLSSIIFTFFFHIAMYLVNELAFLSRYIKKNPKFLMIHRFR